VNSKIPLLFALIFAAVAIYGIMQYLQAQTVRRDTMTIIVAKYNIRENDEITRDALSTKTIETSGFIDSMIPSGQENSYIGYRSLMSFNPDEPILRPALTLERRMRDPLAPKIEGGLRGLSLPVSSTTAVTHLVEVGDHVDIVMTIEVPKITEREMSLSGVTQGGGNVSVPVQNEVREPVTVYVMQDVIVLATGKKIIGADMSRQFEDEFDSGYDTVTLAVTPEEASVLVFAMSASGGSGGGAFTLLLRNPTDSGIMDNPQVTNYKSLLDMVKLSELLNKRKVRMVEVYSAGERR